MAAIWREHGVVAAVTATGFAGGIKLNDVVALAGSTYASPWLRASA